MKKIIIAIACLVLPLTMAQAKSKTKKACQQLIERLAKIQKKGYMYGHQDDPFYGITWDWDYDRSDTYELVGDYPAVMGFDLGGLEVDDTKNLDSVPFTRIHDEIVKHYERGGIITLSWHPRNPLLGTTAWIGNDSVAYNEAKAALCKIRQCKALKEIDNPLNTVKEILPNGKCHAKFVQWLQRISNFIVSLKDKKGNQIPVIFRPWHENTGSWFWWGKDCCSYAEYLGLWYLTQDCINNVVVSSPRGGQEGATLKDYIVWSYSPSWSSPAALERYPGDDRIQLLGTDVYQWGTEADFISQLDNEMRLLTEQAQQRGKLCAITECGYQNSPDATWWQRVFKPVVEKYQFSYLLPWRNYSKDHFGASKDAKTADDFKAWAKQKNFLFVNDIKKIK